jgi:TetR/AcrR family transcriptional regulator, transcriptional repressor for nem operon
MTIVIYIVKCTENLEDHMRVSREKANENREKIIETAARLFREHGFDGVGVDAIMKKAGLTHGGFYGHFKSKDHLAAEAVARALERGTEKMSPFADFESYLAAYLSEDHCADRGDGCGLAALAADIGREGKGVRRALTAYLSERIVALGRWFGGSAAARRKRAIATLSGMVGALTLARAVDDPALSKEILAAAREAFGS